MTESSVTAALDLMRATKSLLQLCVERICNNIAREQLLAAIQHTESCLAVFTQAERVRESPTARDIVVITSVVIAYARRISNENWTSSTDDERELQDIVHRLAAIRL